MSCLQDVDVHIHTDSSGKRTFRSLLPKTFENYEGCAFVSIGTQVLASLSILWCICMSEGVLVEVAFSSVGLGEGGHCKAFYGILAGKLVLVVAARFLMWMF